MSSRNSTGPLQIGDVFLGRYHILEMLGRGGFGCVYRARNDFMGRDVALKVIDGKGGASREAFQRGRQEAQILGQLAHPHIVQVFDADLTAEGKLYIAMELLKGRTLADRLSKDGAFAVQEGLTILECLCSALQFAHERGIAHRDIKPPNIFIGEDGTVKLLDFGIAKMTSNSSFRTAPDMIVGTNLYVAPEQLHAVYENRTHKPAPELSDIYALGLVAFQIFQGTHPLVLQAPHADFRNHFEVWKLHVKTTPPLLHELIRDFPLTVSVLVNTALAKKPHERIGSMAAFLNKTKTARLKMVAEQSPAKYTTIEGRPSTEMAPSLNGDHPAVSTAPLARNRTKKLFNETDQPSRFVDVSNSTAVPHPRNKAFSAGTLRPKASSSPAPHAEKPNTASRTITFMHKVARLHEGGPIRLAILAVLCGLVLSLGFLPLIQHMVNTKKEAPQKILTESTTPLPIPPSVKPSSGEPLPSTWKSEPPVAPSPPTPTPSPTPTPKSAPAVPAPTPAGMPSKSRRSSPIPEADPPQEEAAQNDPSTELWLK